MESKDKKNNNINNTQIPIFYTTESDLRSLIAEEVKNALTPYLSNTSSTLNPEELLTRKEAAKEFKVSLATIDNYMRDGYIMPCRIRGSVRYKREDLQAAFSGNIINPYQNHTKRKKG